MENSINKNEGAFLNRRKLLKTGLALAGGSVLASDISAYLIIVQNNNHEYF
jgi:hypothetical protein